MALDLSGHVAGPFAGSLLGDLGCDVIKVELPDGGDTHRGRNPLYEGYGPSFRALNRNKRSLTLDLRKPRGKEILLKLVEKADILLENFRPETRMKLGPRLRAPVRTQPETDPLFHHGIRAGGSLS